MRVGVNIHAQRGCYTRKDVPAAATLPELTPNVPALSFSQENREAARRAWRYGLGADLDAGLHAGAGLRADGPLQDGKRGVRHAKKRHRVVLLNYVWIQDNQEAGIERGFWNCTSWFLRVKREGLELKEFILFLVEE